jgi:hypothetical protein
MAIIVACKCGKSFQTKDEFAGKTGKCPACGQPILIQAAITPFATAAVPTPPLPPEQEPINARAAAVLEAREKQAEVDRRFLIKMGLVATGVLTVIALGYGLSISMSNSSNSEAAKIDPPKKESVVAPAPPVETKPAVQPPAPQPPSKPVPDFSNFQVKNDIDRYILLALQTRDRHTRMNAKIFRPDEPLLDFEPEDRVTPPDAYKKVEERLNKLGGKMDLDLGPAEKPETDEVEARILLNTELVGDGGWLGTQAGRNNFLVFIAIPTIRMAQITEKYGKPAKSLKSGDFTLHYYGRIVLMENPDGSLGGVARKITRIAKLADTEAKK